MTSIHSFSPVARADARLLILGSMPGEKSLAEQQYYAHPRNAFWSITGELFNFSPLAPYKERALAIIEARVALWDVMATCKRQSSLDSDIVESSIIANDFNVFFGQHPLVEAVYFNGQKAAQSFMKRVAPGLDPGNSISTTVLPSTSPAHAALNWEKKFNAWNRLLNFD